MMSTPAAVTEIQTRSDAAECSRVRKVVCRLASARLRNPTAVGDVELAVGEAFSNAVKHGSGGKVCVRVRAKLGRELAVEMSYPDSGFDTSADYPGDSENGSGGFGRHIMRQVLDALEYSFRNGRTTVLMRKRAAP